MTKIEASVEILERYLLRKYVYRENSQLKEFGIQQRDDETRGFRSIRVSVILHSVIMLDPWAV